MGSYHSVVYAVKQKLSLYLLSIIILILIITLLLK